MGVFLDLQMNVCYASSSTRKSLCVFLFILWITKTRNLGLDMVKSKFFAGSEEDAQLSGFFWVSE